MKKKHLNTLKIASLTLMLGCFAVGGVYNHYKKEQQDHIVKVERNNLQAPRQYVNYNDTLYGIFLSLDEVKDYTWYNFNLICDEIFTNEGMESIFTSIEYNNTELTYLDEDHDTDYYYFSFQYGNNKIGFNTINYDNKFVYYDEEDNELQFQFGLDLYFDGSVYEQIKSAVELDIQANQPVSMGESIIGSIASGLGIIPNIAGEFLAGFSKLLWNNNQLTNFAIYSLVFLGIAITFAIVKLVLMIVRNNTGA